jgi:hypothetical protein
VPLPACFGLPEHVLLASSDVDGAGLRVTDPDGARKCDPTCSITTVWLLLLCDEDDRGLLVE